MAASTTPQGVVDPTKLGKYPIILSDALQGKSPKEVLTAIKYNHKPNLSSDASPSTAKLRPSLSSSPSSSSSTSYDLSFTDDGGKYAYSGSRSTKDNQYVLIFDPERKAFVLHRLDSTFHMNLTRTPSTSDAETLKQEHPHLDSSSIRVSVDKKGPGKGSGAKGGGKGRGNAAKNAGMVESKRSAAAAPATSSHKAKAAPAKEDKKKKKEDNKPPKRARSPADDSEEEYSDDDGGLLVEYPDPQPPTTAAAAATSVHSSFGRARDPSPHQVPTQIRRFSEFMANQTAGDESDEDADAEYEDDLLVEDEGADSSAGDGFKLPSPVGRNGQGQNGVAENGDGDAEGEDDDTPADDELMAMLEEEMGEEGGMDVDSESSVSEED